MASIDRWLAIAARTTIIGAASECTKYFLGEASFWRNAVTCIIHRYEDWWTSMATPCFFGEPSQIKPANGDWQVEGRFTLQR